MVGLQRRLLLEDEGYSESEVKALILERLEQKQKRFRELLRT